MTSWNQCSTRLKTTDNELKEKMLCSGFPEETCEGQSCAHMQLIWETQSKTHSTSVHKVMFYEGRNSESFTPSQSWQGKGQLF